MTATMSVPVEEPWIDTQVVTHPVSELRDCAIVVDASFYLKLMLNTHPSNEPLLTALGGPTGLKHHLEEDLDQWTTHNVTPFFVFDGQSITGQDEVTLKRGREAVEKTNIAWEMYFNNRAEEAVSAFGAIEGLYRTQNLYPILQSLLKERNLHFLVAPYSAAAQIAYFDMLDSDQCAGIMGSLELMLYPINDSIIRCIDWESGRVSSVSKKHVMKALNVRESLFIDGFLMTGTSFLPPFPALPDSSLVKTQPYSIWDAVNMLRASEKSVALTCNTYHDILKSQDPNWQDKYFKARMIVNHFIYIAESGEVKVHDYERLTKDNHEYLGFQLPSELFHYLNVGLIGPRVLTWITHGQLYVLPTMDGVATDEYRKLVQAQVVPIKEAALGLLMPRLHRGIGYKNITMKVWYDRNFSYTVWNLHEVKPDFAPQVGSWNIKESTIKEHFPQFSHGSIVSEVLSLRNPDFVAKTLWPWKEKIRGLDSAAIIKSITIWRYLHVRGYANDQHELTPWGKALAAAMAAFEPTSKKYADVPNLFEAVIVAFELLRFGLLSARNPHEELHGLPMHGTEEDRANLLLISRCATMLKLRHQDTGYTGPLSKNFLVFGSMASEVRSANRDLIEAILASMFMYAQAQRKRDDSWQISHELPFLNNPDVALGIAVKTYLDEVNPTDSAEVKAANLEAYPKIYVPHAAAFSEDFEIACNFFNAIHAGVKALDGTKEISPVDRATWDKAARYLELRL